MLCCRILPSCGVGEHVEVLGSTGTGDDSVVQFGLRERRLATVRPRPAFEQQCWTSCTLRFQPLRAWAKSQDG